VFYPNLDDNYTAVMGNAIWVCCIIDGIFWNMYIISICEVSLRDDNIISMCGMLKSALVAVHVESIGVQNYFYYDYFYYDILRELSD